jgi:aminomethyltransferase
VLRTPLHSFHAEHGAHMVEFAGWEMPIRYTSIIEEHNQTRNSGGLFDVSHMARLKITGRHARRLLERACTRRIGDMQNGQCRYSLVLNEQGGVRDDVIVYRFDDDDYLVVVNASNRAKIVDHLNGLVASGELKVKIDDQTESTAMVAIQGPKVMELISKVSSEVPTLKRYRFTVKNLLIAKLIVSRTGYTGEDGVEVILPAGMVGMAMKLLLKDVDMASPDGAVKPIGLGARDTLRLEAGMPLYGHELGEDISALEAGLDFAIAIDKDKEERGEAFVGQEALRATLAQGGPARKLVGLSIEGKRTPRQGMAIEKDGAVVGIVTSGTMSPTLGRPIAMGYVAKEHGAEGTALTVNLGSASVPATVCAMPFYKAKK